MSTLPTMKSPEKKQISRVGAFLSAAFWVTATSAFAASAVRSAAPFGRDVLTSYATLMKTCDANPIATVFVLIWSVLVFGALASIVRRVVGVRGTWGASLAVATASVVSLFESFAAGRVGIDDSDRAAVLMVTAAFAFAGNSRLWWLVLAPILAACAIAPVAWLEFWQAVGSTDLARAAAPAVLASCLASLIVVVRETRARVLEARSGIAEVTRREEVVATTLVSFSRAVAQTMRVEAANPAPLGSMEETIEATASRMNPNDVLSAFSQTTTVEIETPENAPSVSGSVTYQDLQILASEALEVVRVKWASRSDVWFAWYPVRLGA
ncbi:MAG: hypothetical protein V4760_08955, partial [Bdellovibrionota bacterium]